MSLTYNETLFFIAKSLTISLEEKNRDEIELLLKNKNIDWEAVVEISSAHLVFSALYCNLKRVDFLKYIPLDLVSYMEYITHLNRNRNKQIIEQAKNLNSVLLDNGIRPFFLKGTGNILEGLYEDIGERMVGDIDFLVQQKDFFKAIDILKNDNYTIPERELDYFQGFRHYSRLVKKGNIAAVEIHKEVTIDKYRGEFNCEMISKDPLQINDILVLSFENQLSLSIISNQINDYGFYFKRFSLRNAYDVLLLSKKVNTKNVISRFSKLKKTLNYFITNCNFVFGDLESLEYHKTKETEKYIKTFNKSLNKSRSKIKVNFKMIMINLKRRFVIVCLSILNSKNRKWLINRIKSKLFN